MPKLKVLFLIESFIVGGAEKVLVDIVNHLDAEKFDITVCSVFKKSVYKGYDKYFDRPFNANIHYRCLVDNDNRLLYVVFNYLLARVPNVLYRLLVGDKYDRVVAFYEGLPTYWIAKANIKRGEKIAWLHTSTTLSQKGKDKEELLKTKSDYGRFKKIVAVSNCVSNSFANVFPCVASKLIIAYNPIDRGAIIKKASLAIDREKPKESLFVSVDE